MSTFLQLVNRARERCKVSGADLTTLVSVTGQSLWFKNAVIDAWEEIQELHTDWYWMRSTYSFTTTADDGDYTSSQAGISSRFGYWDRTYATVYVTATGVSDQTELCWLDYETFRAYYLTGSQSSGRPLHFSIGLSNELLIGPEPDSTAYTITGQYWKSAQTLSANSDEPELPEQHKIIPCKVMMKYGVTTPAPEILAEGESEYRRILSQLERRYLPQVQLAGPLV